MAITVWSSSVWLTGVLAISAVAIRTAAAVEPLLEEGRVDGLVEEGPIDLDDVLDSVDRSYPLLLAALVEIERIEAEALAARGAFDTRLLASGAASPTGFYDHYTGDMGIEQPTRLWGARLFAGYRIGRGDFPSYMGGDKTNEGGEVRAGVEVPLLKGGITDESRTRLRTTELGQQAVLPQVEQRRIEIVRDASETYWDWVAMGLNVQVERRLLATAEARQAQFQGQAERGAIPRVQLVDNERLIVDRKIRLRGAERDAREAAVALSLFFRDEAGRTVLPPPERVPGDFPPEYLWGEAQLERDIARASEAHPILRELRLRRQQIEATVARDRNALLPDLRLQLEGSQDFGESAKGIDTKGNVSDDPKDQTEVKASLRLELPVLQRQARGRLVQSQADLRRLDYEIGFQRDRIQAEILRATAALEAAYDQTNLARENLELAQQLERAEERKLSLGSSNLINVNIRELQAADAARALIFAQAAYFRSLARYQAAVATYDAD
jgi:outer membrane protein TolC